MGLVISERCYLFQIDIIIDTCDHNYIVLPNTDLPLTVFRMIKFKRSVYVGEHYNLKFSGQ